MVENNTNQNLSFCENQLQIIKEQKDVHQQIKIFEKFFLLYNNCLLKKYCWKYSLLVQEKEKEIESIWENIYKKNSKLRLEENKIDLHKDYNDKDFRERKRHERKVNLHIEKKYLVRENKLIDIFFETVEKLTQDLNSEDRQTLSFICKLCYETEQERENNDKIKKIPYIQIGEELQKRFFATIWFELMTRKPTKDSLQSIELLKKLNADLRNKHLELMWDFAKNNFDDISNPSEQTIGTQVEKHKEHKKKQEQIDIEKKSQKTIYRWKGSLKHQMGWIFFFILIPLGIHHYLKLKKKKVKIKNPFDEIKSKFESWRLNIYSSLGFYLIFFVLIEQALTKFRPWLEKFVNNHQNLAFWITALLLGVLLVIDGFISSNLKTNLQRLSFNVEQAVSDKNLKKKIFFKTQDSTETLKENFKKFGMLAIPTMIIGILGNRWKENWLSYGYYLIPVGYSFIRIWEVNNILKKVKSAK